MTTFESSVIASETKLQFSRENNTTVDDAPGDTITVGVTFVEPRNGKKRSMSWCSQAARQQAMYDMVYVERLPEEQQMTSGLFLPSKENPRMHVCKVVSLGHGREGESGHVTPNEAVKPGDLVYVKDPYGIGPRDDEFAGKKFSFVRYSSICGIIPDSQGYEEAARKAGKMQEEVDRATGAAGNIGF